MNNKKEELLTLIDILHKNGVYFSFYDNHRNAPYYAFNFSISCITNTSSGSNDYFKSKFIGFVLLKIMDSQPYFKDSKVYLKRRFKKADVALEEYFDFILKSIETSKNKTINEILSKYELETI